MLSHKEEKTFTVYSMKNKISGKVYVGATSRKLEERYPKNSWHHVATNECLKNDLIQFGQDNFCLSVLCTCSSKEEMDQKETEFILKLDSRNPSVGYNTYTGGVTGSKAGAHHVERMLSNLGENRRIGWRHMWDNKSHREMLCSAISKSKKGKAPNLSPEAKERQRLAVRETGLKNRGKKKPNHTEETKRKMSESAKKLWAERKNALT